MKNEKTVKELGFEADIALRELLLLYARCKKYKYDWQVLNGHPEIVEAKLMLLKKILESPEARAKKEALLQSNFYKGKENFVNLAVLSSINDQGYGLLHDFGKGKTLFDILTQNLKHAWDQLKVALSEGMRLKVRARAEKWGLRCDWGCGLLTGQHPDYYINSFIIFPGPPGSARRFDIEARNNLIVSPCSSNSSMTRISFDVNAFDNVGESLIDENMIRNLNDSVACFIKKWKENAKKLGYKGFESNLKKDSIADQAQWLFWRITPPYLNAQEIAGRIANAQEQDPDVDERNISRKYQRLAKLLGIKISKGWPKGRHRFYKKENHDQRAEIFHIDDSHS